MKWFKHESDDRNKLESKLIRTRFGAEGYGIYQSLIEVVAEYVDKETIGKWGHVHPLHDLDTLAIECSTTKERLIEFLEYCDTKGIFLKDEKGLFYPLIEKRLDSFFERVQRDTKQTTKSVRTNSVPSTAIEEKRRDKKRIEENRFTSVDEITSEVEQEISNHYQILLTSVQKKKLAMQLWLDEEPSRYLVKGKPRNLKMTLMKWLREDMEKGSIKKQVMSTLPDLPEISDEQRERNIQRLQQIKQQFPVGRSV